MAFFYTTSQSATAVTAASELLSCTVAADKPVELWGFDIGNTTDLGDAAEEVLQIGIYSAPTGGGAGGALTEVALHENAPAAGAAWLGLGTASTGGTLRKTIYWNVRQAGPAWIATPETTIRISAAADPICFRLIAAPADSITLGYEVLWKEL